jgi:hypothetical protein
MQNKKCSIALKRVLSILPEFTCILTCVSPECHQISHRKKVQSIPIIPIPHMTNLDNWVQNNNIFKVPTLFFK